VYARTPEPDITDPAAIYQGGGFLFQGEPMTAHKAGK
jgi:uronate dehydrogenase